MFWIDKAANTKQKYYNKILALKYCSEPEFYLSDEYDTYNWLAEPSGSWQEVLTARARQIRADYKYIRLLYSGGTDSQTVLDIFVNNNIYLDEIAIWRQSPVDNFTGLSNSEANQVAIPYLQFIKNRILNTKINILDMGCEAFDNWYNRGNFLADINSNLLRPGYTSNLHLMIPGANDIPGLCNITGLEKPTIKVDEHGIYWQYPDNAFGGQLVSKDMGEESQNIHFFLDPTVHSKQCHLIKNEYLRTKDTDLLDRKTHALINKIVRNDLVINYSIAKWPPETNSKFTFGSENLACCIMK